MKPRRLGSARLQRELVNETRIASPCDMSWDEMKGDDKVRFCLGCRLNVYNLSAMDVEEAAELIAGRDGRLCASFYRRQDGTILTQDCPEGVEHRNRRRAMVRAVGVAAGALAGISAFVPLVTLGTGRRAGVIADVSPEHEPIYRAANGDLDILRERLNAGWNPNTTLSSGATALMLAAGNGETAAMRLLIDHGADVDAKARGGETALQWAKESNQNGAVKLLRAAGAR